MRALVVTVVVDTAISGLDMFRAATMIPIRPLALAALLSLAAPAFAQQALLVDGEFKGAS